MTAAAKTETLAAALVAAQAAMPPVLPDKQNPHFRSMFVSLDHLIAKTRPVLNKHGLAISQAPTHIDGQPALETTIHHVSGEARSSVMPLLLGKQDMQQIGSALTYARRYAWAAALGICSDEDDDGEQNAIAAQISPEGKTPAQDPQAASVPSADERAAVGAVLASQSGGGPQPTQMGAAAPPESSGFQIPNPPPPASTAEMAAFNKAVDEYAKVKPEFDAAGARRTAKDKDGPWVVRQTARVRENIEAAKVPA